MPIRCYRTITGKAQGNKSDSLVWGSMGVGKKKIFSIVYFNVCHSGNLFV